MSNPPIEQALALIEQSLSFIKADIKHIKSELDGKYVTQSQFEPVRKIVYGATSIVGVTIIGAVIALILK